MLLAIASSFGGLALESPASACPFRWRRTCFRSSTSYARLAEPPEILGYEGVYVAQVYDPFDSSLFGLRTRNIHTDEGRQLIESVTVPDLRQRQISHKRDEWQVIPDTWNNAVTLAERRLGRYNAQDKVIYISAGTHTNTGPGVPFPLYVTFMDGSGRYYDDREAYISFWDHTVRIQAFQSGSDAARIQIKWEKY